MTEPRRWLEGEAPRDLPGLAEALAGYAGQRAPAARREQVFEQLAVQLAPARPSGLDKLRLGLGTLALCAGMLGLWQVGRPPEPSRVPSSREPFPGEMRTAPWSLSPPAREAPSAVAVLPDEAQARGRVQRSKPARPLPVPRVEAEAVAAQGAEPTLVMRELSLLAKARRALINEPERALALSTLHASTYPHGTFEEEREVIAIESLLKLGRSDAARVRALAFERTFPRSPQLAHLAKMIAKPRP